MINPVGVSLKMPTADTAMKVVEGSQKAISKLTNLKEESDEFKKNLKQDSDAFSDAITNVADNVTDNKVLAPVGKLANSKVGKKIAGVLGTFTAFCTNLAGSASAISTTTFMNK